MKSIKKKTMSIRRKKFILIDGNAIIHRSYHALPPFTTKSGELVNAVYGFASTLLSVIDKFKPDYIAVTFDLKAPTFRHKQFKDYKATRVKAPKELYTQIERVKEITRAFGIPIYEKKGFEADDLIGTIAKKYLKNGNKNNIEIIIVTGDLDALQLVDEYIKVWTVSRGINKAVLYDEKAVKKRYDLKPTQLKDYKGLCGDSSDNIPGVRGVGSKGATNLLKKYRTLEGVYNHLDEIKGGLHTKLRQDKKMAILSKKLGTIKTDLDIDFNIRKCKTADYNHQNLIALFQELGFQSLIKRLYGNKKLNENNKKLNKKEIQITKIKLSELDNFLKEVEKQKEVVVVFEKIESEDGLILSFVWEKDRVNFLYVDKKNLLKIKEILENETIIKIGWKLKNDYKYLKKNKGVELLLVDFSDKKKNILCKDIMIIEYLLNSGTKINLEKVVAEELGDTFDDKNKDGGQMNLLESISLKNISDKICQKAYFIFQLKNILENKLEKIDREQRKNFAKNGLKSVLNKIELPLIVVLAEMELKGIKVNKIIFKGISEKIDIQVKKLEKEIQDLAGEKFNVNSTQQLREVLFKKLNISTQGIKKTKTGFSTAATELNKLRGKHKIIEKIEKYREIFKLKTTYLDTFPELIEEDGRIHTTFNQVVTATGRLSSENPNLQNIPIRTELGKIIRTAFEADEGKSFVSADYSQIDLRVMAHMSKDKKLIESFWAGEDIHIKTAMEINKIPRSRVTKKMRYQAKALNFGVIYGMGSYGFSQSASISQEDAKNFINKYMQEFPDVAKFIKKTKEFARENGFVETEMGRRRYLPEINSPNFQIQAGAERMAINMPIQGLAADIMKLAMIAVYNYYEKDSGVDMVLQIHDEIILEVDEDRVDEVAEKTKEIMEGVYKLEVPLVADIKIGKNWGEL